MTQETTPNNIRFKEITKEETEKHPISTAQIFTFKVNDETAETMKRNKELREHYNKENGHPAHDKDKKIDVLLRSWFQTKVKVAEHMLEEEQKSLHGSEEDFHKKEQLDNLIELFKAEEQIFSLYAKFQDEPNLQDLVSIADRDIPFLKETQRKIKERFDSEF